MAVQIQLRHDLAATWLTANPILAAGEVGIEIDTRKAKIGVARAKFGTSTCKAYGTIYARRRR